MHMNNTVLMTMVSRQYTDNSSQLSSTGNPCMIHSLIDMTKFGVDRYVQYLLWTPRDSAVGLNAQGQYSKVQHVATVQYCSTRRDSTVTLFRHYRHQKLPLPVMQAQYTLCGAQVQMGHRHRR